MNENINQSEQPADENHIAVIGLAGRYPKSSNIDEFWSNLKNGVDCLEGVSDDELEALGIPSDVYSDPRFVRRGTRLPFADCFDARFFGFTPRETEAMDPQCRIFLETCYEAIENAGYNPFSIEGQVGVFAGSNPNDYASLVGVADPTDSLGAFDQLIGSDKDFLATRVSHKLNLKGPSLTVQTACSTSLVTVHMAVQSLLSYESTMCLAGGVTVNFRQGVGYFYQDGMILSPDGKCRAFDADASGTTLGQGCGVVLLKRLEDALTDNDHVYAIIRGSAINNDGSDKISFTAPSENGQAEVISLAHQLAEVESDTIGYVETHGTGTKLGDPIEIAGLTRAFAPGTNRIGYCAVGSAKTNFGHTDAAAGITGFLKTVLSLYKKQIVPSLHFSHPNPVIEFEKTPFYVNSVLQDWESSESPRRGCVSAFGIGGTNAHIVLEEAAEQKIKSSRQEMPLIVPLSAKNKNALQAKISDLKKYLEYHPSVPLEDIAFTLRYGRPEFQYRATLAISEREVSEISKQNDFDASLSTGHAIGGSKKVVWMFSGQGSQYVGMCTGLYNSSSVFKDTIDECSKLFVSHIGLDIRELIFTEENDESVSILKQTTYTQPVLFAVEYALSKLLHSWGLKPDVVVGHSIGEYAAAVEAGILSLQDAVKVVSARGKLMQAMEPGAMLSVPMNSSELANLLPQNVEIAAENAQSLCVVSGPETAIDLFCVELRKKEVDFQRVQTSHAFHSAMMKPAAKEFERVLNGVKLNTPSIPMTSNVTGVWITDEEATSPSFWASQITSAVKFSGCISTTAEAGESVYLELGPGRTLAGLVKKNNDINAQSTGISGLVRHPSTQSDDYTHALGALGKLWCFGLKLNWEKMGGGLNCRRVPLPTYPFARERHWGPSRKHVLALPHFGELSDSYESPLRRNNLEQWLYVPSWKRIADLPSGRQQNDSVVRVLLLPSRKESGKLMEKLSLDGDSVLVFPADRYEAIVAGKLYSVNPSFDEDLEAVFEELLQMGIAVTHITHAWLAETRGEDCNISLLDGLNLGVHSAHVCARAASRFVATEFIQLDFITTGAHLVTGNEKIFPEAAALLGPAKVVPLEYPGLNCRHVDLENGLSITNDFDQLSKLLETCGDDQTLAIRGKYLWEYRVEKLGAVNEPNFSLRDGGCYLIVGGTGGVGLSIARFLVDKYNAKIALTGRTGRPTRSDDEESEANRRLDLLESIERDASGTLVLAADTTDEESMGMVVDQVQDQFGDINGVIVAAGIADQAGAIHRRSREQAVSAIASKVHGSRILYKLFKNKNLDFLFFSSSIASMLYHNRFGQVGYVTANSYVEAFALKLRQNGVPAITVAWDDWMNIGMSVRAAAEFSETYGTNVKLVDDIHSFTPEDGIELFRLAINSGEPLLYVSTTDLNVRMKQDINVVSPFLEQAIGNEDTTDRIEKGSSIKDVIEKIWSELLGFESFEETDDFFDLGGDSLQAARMADKLGRALNIEIPLNTIFDKSNLNALTKELENASNQIKNTKEREALEGSVPMGPAQKRFLARNNPNPNHFNISVMLSSTSVIDAEKLEQALKFLVEHHDSLRFRLSERNTHHSQECVHATEIGFKLDHFVKAEPDEANIERISNEMQNGLDLWNGPVFRAALIETRDNHQLLLLVVHHMVSDRISLFLLMDGLNQIYPQLVDGKSPILPSRTASYSDWVTEQNYIAFANEEKINKILNQDWKAIGRLPLLKQYQPSLNTNESASAFTVSIKSNIAKAVLQNDGARADEILLLALSSAISGWTGSDTVLIETLGHGRRNVPKLDVSRTTGFFLSYNTVLVDFSESKQLKESVDDLRLAMESAWIIDIIKENHQNDELRKQLAELPKAEVLYNFVGREILAEKDAFFNTVDQRRGAETDKNGIRDHLIAVRVEVLSKKGIELTIVFSEAFHNLKMIESFAERIEHYLCDMVTDKTENDQKK